MTENAIRTEAGPAVAKAVRAPISNPGPKFPSIAIMEICRADFKVFYV